MSEPIVFSDPAQTQKIQDQFYTIEMMRDFITYLFDNHIDFMTESEAWEMFNKQTEIINP